MGQIAYVASDLIKDLAASAIAITSEDANYPETNLQNEQVALCTRTTAKVAIKFQFDLGSTKQPMIFAILNHNFSGGTYDINSYTAADYTTGKIAVEANKAIRQYDTMHYESAAPTARRYWELDFTNATSASSYFEIGRIMVQTAVVTITDIEDYIVSRGYGFRNIINETIYGVRWVHKLTNIRERFELSWGERTAANAIHTQMRTLYAAVYGNANPFLYIPDITGTACYYVYIEDAELLYQQIWASDVGGIKLRLIEAVRGKA